MELTLTDSEKKLLAGTFREVIEHVLELTRERKRSDYPRSRCAYHVSLDEPLKAPS